MKSFIIRAVCALLLLALCSSALISCSLSDFNIQKYSRSYFDYFDTVVTVTGLTHSRDEFDNACVFLESRLGYYNRLFDIFNSYDNVTNLASVNECAGEHPVTVDDNIIELLTLSVTMFEKTGGAVNVALGAVTSLWRECASGASDGVSDHIPPQEELEACAAHCDISSLRIDADANTVYISDPLCRIDCGAIAKGFAAEKIAREIENEGYTCFSLDFGGNIRVIGDKPDGSAWVSGISDPANESSILDVRVSLSDNALVTSGIYRRYFMYNGKQYHHIIDPETLFPGDRYQAVSIIADDSGVADALSTALFNCDIESGKRILSAFDGTGAMWVNNDGSIVMSDIFSEAVID